MDKRYKTSSGTSCSVKGCNNSDKQKFLWESEDCPKHLGKKKMFCKCKRPFKFFRFPKDSTNISRRTRLKWLSSIKRVDFNPCKTAVVCSDHFTRGKPSDEHPYPVLHIDQNLPVISKRSSHKTQTKIQMQDVESVGVDEVTHPIEVIEPLNLEKEKTDEPDNFSSVIILKSENEHCCGNCGITLEKDPLEECDFLTWDSELFQVNSITVGDAIAKIFKTKFAEGTFSNSLLCPGCYGALQDLFSIWQLFVSKTTQSSILYPYLRDGEVEDVGPLLSEPPQFPAKTRLEARIARRSQTQQNHKPSDSASDLLKQEMHNGIYECTDDLFQPTITSILSKNLQSKNETNLSSNTKRKNTKSLVKILRVKTKLPDNSPSISCKADHHQRTYPPSSRKTRQSTGKMLLSETDLQSDNDHEKTLDESENNGSDFHPEDYDSEDFQEDEMVSTKKKRSKTPDTGTILKPFVCDECGRKFEKEVGLSLHIGSIHRNVRGPFICDFENCGKNLRSSGCLNDHMNQHFGLKPYICDQCGWSTTAAALLRRHQQIHLKPDEKDALKIFVCDICRTKFVNKGYLNAHRTVHSNEKPFQCSYKGCHSRFKLRQKLNHHEKEIHLGQTEIWTCQRCKREFTRNSNFKRHMDIHLKYDLTGGKMRKSRDPPVRDKIPIKTVDVWETRGEALSEPCPTSCQKER